MFLSVIVTLLAAGTLILVIGVIFLMATIVPLWAALLIAGIVVSGTGVTLASIMFSDKIVLKTPLASEMIKNERP
jgi:hypothetical protein